MKKVQRATPCVIDSGKKLGLYPWCASHHGYANHEHEKYDEKICDTWADLFGCRCHPEDTRVHNHDYDASCPEIVEDDGSLVGECLRSKKAVGSVTIGSTVISKLDAPPHTIIEPIQTPDEPVELYLGDEVMVHGFLFKVVKLSVESGKRAELFMQSIDEEN